MTSVPPPQPVWDAHPSTTSVRYAGFWFRVLAAIIDGIALAIAAKIVGFFLPAPPLPPSSANIDAIMAYANALMPTGTLIADALIAWAYFALQESSAAQATIGKRLLGIRVSTEDGGRLSLASASLRAWPLYLPNIAWLVGSWLGGLVGLAAFVACICVAFSERKQGLHDRMAGAVLTRQ
jgi:uncharacterized RDD family membrane protein YckC